MFRFLVIWLLLTSPSFTSAATNSTAVIDTYSIIKPATITKPGCLRSCGNLTIPYPFGVGLDSDCAMKGFEISCNTTFNPPQAFIGNILVYDISDEHMRISNIMARRCYDSDGSINLQNSATSDITGTPYSYSPLNKFTLIGCDDFALLSGEGSNKVTTGCISLCHRVEDVSDGVCSGKGCCEALTTKGMQYYFIAQASLSNHTNVSSFNPCSYSFLVEEGRFEFRASDMRDPLFQQRVRTTLPILLDWRIGNSSCAVALNTGDYACRGNSYCVDSDTGLGGYRCRCNDGYEGNPYLDHGCTDIDECADSNLNNCIDQSQCINESGSFRCVCPSGQFGDATKNGKGCNTPKFPEIKVVIGSGIGFIFVAALATWLYLSSNKRKLRKRRQNFFQRNGGFLLKKQISLKESSIESTKIFTTEDLKKATNNYANDRILGKGGYGTVYKGILPDNRIVAIKKSTVIDETQIEQFINEVIILTQINHRNVVKLLGCCLESEVPLLVYEYVSHGTLFDHIQNKDNQLSWENRVRIASEAAGALSYLHSAASTPIIHRDVKSTNILLDEHYTAKISDFGASRLIPLDQKRVTTMVIGTFGYLDPEYFHTSHLTDKSDVYSFGVVLIELMTGQKPIDMEKSEEQRSLTVYFISSMNENRLFEILEPRVVREGNWEQIEAMAELIKRCLHLNRDERPTMKEVATELEVLRKLTRADHQYMDQEYVGFNELSADLYAVSVSPCDSTEEFLGKYSSSSGASQV